MIAWKAPYTGTVTLWHEDTVYRNGAPETAGDITATIKLNNDELWRWVFDKTCINTPGKTATYSASNGAYVNDYFIMGGNNAPTAIAWKAPYSGTVKLYEDSYIVYRSSANESGANVTAVIKINDRAVTLDNGNAAQWTFDNRCDHDNGAISYTIQNLHVNKGDIIYHEVDCGTNLTSADIFWRPIVEYTAFDNTSYSQTTSPAITGSEDNQTGFVTTIEATDDITISQIRWNVTSSGTTKLLTPGSLPITTLESGATVSFKVIVENLKDNAATAVAVVE